MSYHRGMGDDEPFVIPPPPTDAEMEHRRAMRRVLVARIKNNGAVTREEVLHMLGTLPVCDSWGGPPCPPYPSDVKTAVERMALGAIVPAAWVQRVYAQWNPGGV